MYYSHSLGIMGLFGNKGCVSCRLYLGETAVTVLCCHLASGTNNNDRVKRVAMAKECLDRANFDMNKAVSPQLLQQQQQQQQQQQNNNNEEQQLMRYV